MLVAGALLLGLVLGVALTLALTGRLDRERRDATAAHVATLAGALEFERGRARDLGAMLDQAVAARLDVVPPASATVGPAPAPLPAEMLAELDQLDSDAARAEFEILLRDAIARHPERSTAEILAAVMPS